MACGRCHKRFRIRASAVRATSIGQRDTSRAANGPVSRAAPPTLVNSTCSGRLTEPRPGSRRAVDEARDVPDQRPTVASQAQHITVNNPAKTRANTMASPRSSEIDCSPGQRSAHSGRQYDAKRCLYTALSTSTPSDCQQPGQAAELGHGSGGDSL
eukprot:CAMPEP_0170373030 /NCGR_PEP_ID=MMETSP0117_2-20130122/9861_1 /TAXON_ID=400756 /ORGANISM="Durinskia baltica, Strain CSIRO CS-38" /LENGTH=155 /DNA_ID=CAMNT_0010627913 /DNA_START=49 /DNA_END=513 /DNA_ORIENTATION=+